MPQKNEGPTLSRYNEPLTLDERRVARAARRAERLKVKRPRRKVALDKPSAKRSHAISDDECKVVARRALSGEDRGALAAEYEVSRWTLNAAIKRSGIHVPVRRAGLGGSPSALSPSSKDKIKELWAAGEHNQAALARQFEVSRNVISRFLVLEGLHEVTERDGPGAPRRFGAVEAAEVLVVLEQDELSYTEIGRQFDCSRHTVERIAREAGVKRPPGWKPRSTRAGLSLEDFEDRVVELWTGSAMTKTEISREVGVTFNAVDRALKRRGNPTKEQA